MNDRSRSIAVTVIGIIGSSLAALTVVFLGGLKSILATVLLATLAGTLGHFAFTALGTWLMRLQKRWSLGRPGGSVYAFSTLPPEEATSAGGKGRVLADLYQRGFPVPDGCVLLPVAFEGDALTDAAWEEVKAQLARLRQGQAFSFAVRSSALSEDSAQASFAGEFESVLDVRTDQQIREAITAVRKSAHSERVQSYRQAKGLDGNEHAVAVIIQRLVRPEYAGVLFTADPLTGDLMQMSGNFVTGLGEALVSGQANAQTFSLSRPDGAYRGPLELSRLARALYRDACRLEKDLGGPQDIEWAVAGGRLFILQSRPITTMATYKADTAEWNDSLRGNFLWSGTNLVENAPQVLTPFSCSLRKGLVYEGMDLCDSSSMGVDGYPMAGIIGGRGYINLSIQIASSRAFFGGDSRKTLQQIASWWGKIPQGLEIPLVPISRWDWWTKVMPALNRYLKVMGRLRKQIPQFIAENPQWCATICQRIRQIRNGAELAALMRDEIQPYSVHAFFLTFAGAPDASNRLENDLQKLVGADDANALLSNVTGLSSGLASLGPLTGLSKVARGEMSREAYLQAYGHRGVNENEYGWQRPIEDPAWLDRQLAEFVQASVDIDAMFARQRAGFEAAWERFCARYPQRSKYMRLRLEKAAKDASLREAVRSEATRSSMAIRMFALRAGELTGLGEDIFFFTMPEVVALLGGDDTPRGLLPLRKQTHERYCALPPYPTIIVGRFDPFQWAADPNRRSDIYIANTPAAVEDRPAGSTIQGFAGALGVVEGTVRRLDRLEDSGQFKPGEILVTTLTNIGWTPLFPRAAAIVTDLGAPLSHAAIVARELGIPAVVGCGDATMRLNTGDRVRVNGGQGLVEILEATHAAQPDG